MSKYINIFKIEKDKPSTSTYTELRNSNEIPQQIRVFRRATKYLKHDNCKRESNHLNIIKNCKRGTMYPNNLRISGENKYTYKCRATNKQISTSNLNDCRMVTKYLNILRIAE